MMFWFQDSVAHDLGGKLPLIFFNVDFLVDLFFFNVDFRVDEAKCWENPKNVLYSCNSELLA